MRFRKRNLRGAPGVLADALSLASKVSALICACVLMASSAITRMVVNARMMSIY